MRTLHPDLEAAKKAAVAAYAEHNGVVPYGISTFTFIRGRYASREYKVSVFARPTDKGWSFAYHFDGLGERSEARINELLRCK